MSDVSYEPKALVISIPTADPTALHAALLQSITNSLSYCMVTPDKPKEFKEDMVTMLSLLKTMLPTEGQLC